MLFPNVAAHVRGLAKLQWCRSFQVTPPGQVFLKYVLNSKLRQTKKKAVLVELAFTLNIYLYISIVLWVLLKYP